MRILHVIESLAPKRGGPVTVLRVLATEQAKVGHVVTILTTNQDYPSGIYCLPGNSRINDAAVEVIYCASEFPALNVSLSLANHIRKNVTRYDIIHIHGLYRFPSTYAAYVARSRGVPYVVTPHGALDPFLFARSGRNLLLKRLWERLFDLPNLHGASAIHFTAKDEQRLAGFLALRAPSFVVPNGIDWVPFENLPKRGSFRERHGIGGEPLVLFLGRLHFKKGLDILIPAFARVLREFPSARLAIIGPDNDSYEKQVFGWINQHNLREATIREDFLAGADLLQAYVDSDVFVLSSYSENFGMTVVESMACGCPVVISNRVNIHSEITDAGAGIVTGCDAEEVMQSVVALLKDPLRRQEMGAKGRFAARERYAWPGIVESLTCEYQKIIARVN